MKSGWKELEVPVNYVFRIPKLSRACQIVLFFIADSADSFNPGNSDLAEKIGTDRKNVGRYTSELEKKGFIVRNGLDKDGRTIWLINTKTVKNTLQLSQDRCHQSEDTRHVRCHQSEDGGCHQSEDGGAINLRTQPSNKLSNLTFKDIGKTDKTSVSPKPKKKTKRSKPKTTTWSPDHTLSRIFTLLLNFEPYSHVFDVSTDNDYLTSFLEGSYRLTLSDLTEYVEEYVRYYKDPNNRNLKPKGVRNALSSWIKRDQKKQREKNPPRDCPIIPGMEEFS